jgi:hypothetical protein
MLGSELQDQARESVLNPGLHILELSRECIARMVNSCLPSSSLAMISAQRAVLYFKGTEGANYKRQGTFVR